MGVGVSAGDSVIRVVTSGTAPSTTTNNLFVGDTIALGSGNSGGGLTIFSIKDIGDTATIMLNSVVGATNAFFGSAVIATRSAIHTISWTPQSNITGGYWQFLIKASSRTGENAFDGIPDQQGFDLGATTPTSGANGLGTRVKTTDITCPNFGAGTAAFSVGTTVGVVVGGATNYYHVITCQLGTGNTNQVGVGYTVAIGAALASGSQFINPSPSNGHTEGNADVYTFYVRHLDASQVLVTSDTAQGKIAAVESIRVTATVDPTLTFSIDAQNVGSGGTPCGLTLGANANNTTGDSVSFGSISLGVFNDLAQRLSAVTNATSGYIVTVYENAPMHNLADNSTLPDTTCDLNSCSVTTAGTWAVDNSSSKWGYTIQNLSVGETIFSYQQGYKAFGSGSVNAQQIMRNSSTPTTNERANVCYRLTASTTQEAGNYENKLTYTVTATF